MFIKVKKRKIYNCHVLSIVIKTVQNGSRKLVRARILLLYDFKNLKEYLKTT